MAPVTRSCSRCGATAEGPVDGLPEGWSFGVEGDRMTWTCGPCLRFNIRAIEGKLPEEWWG